MNEILKSAVYGFAVGDALGVPYEFKERGHFVAMDMVENGSHNQPIGTWSDDTSLVLATCESIKRCGKIDTVDIMKNFSKWYYDGEFTATGQKFDVGGTVARAIERYKNNGILYGDENDIYSNGNGSLMRILPLAFCEDRLQYVNEVSALTHAHPISKIACLLYVEILFNLSNGKKENIVDAIHNSMCNISEIANVLWGEYINKYYRIETIGNVSQSHIRSTPYVVDTLEAALWCVIFSYDYTEAVLTAVNLGGDTDTISALTGALAGVIYGYESIPNKWIDNLKNKELIESCLF